jgi:hypothetical protein
MPVRHASAKPERQNAIPEWDTRQFGSFREAAQQAATSRLYGGIHYPMAIEAGCDQGVASGRWWSTVCRRVGEIMSSTSCGPPTWQRFNPDRKTSRQ